MLYHKWSSQQFKVKIKMYNNKILTLIRMKNQALII